MGLRGRRGAHKSQAGWCANKRQPASLLPAISSLPLCCRSLVLGRLPAISTASLVAAWAVSTDVCLLGAAQVVLVGPFAGDRVTDLVPIGVQVPLTDMLLLPAAQ